MKKQGVGWIRVSSPKQWDDGDHIKMQIKIKQWCDENSMLFMERPASQYRKHEDPWDDPNMSSLLKELNMLAELDKQPDMVVAVRLDRFGNEHIILNVLLPFFDGRDVAMVAIEQNVNSHTDRAGFVKAVHDAEITERDKKRTEATQDNRIYKLRLRKHQYGRGLARPIFGLLYSNELKEYTEREDYIDVVKEIYVLYVYDHMTLTQICTELGSTTIKTLRRKSWTEKTVANILRNEAYSSGITRAGIKCPVSVPVCTAKRAIARLDMEKGGRKASSDEPLRKIVYCGDCDKPMKLRRRKYVCSSCKQAKEESWILGKAIEQAKVELSSILSGIVSKLDIGEWLLKRNELKSRIDIVLCNYERLKADDRKESIRMLRNYIPFELNKRILVYTDAIELVGMSEAEVMEELDLRDSDWLEYVYV